MTIIITLDNNQISNKIKMIMTRQQQQPSTKVSTSVFQVTCQDVKKMAQKSTKLTKCTENVQEKPENNV